MQGPTTLYAYRTDPPSFLRFVCRCCGGGEEEFRGQGVGFLVLGGGQPSESLLCDCCCCCLPLSPASNNARSCCGCQPYLTTTTTDILQLPRHMSQNGLTATTLCTADPAAAKLPHHSLSNLNMRLLPPPPRPSCLTCVSGPGSHPQCPWCVSSLEVCTQQYVVGPWPWGQAHPLHGSEGRLSTIHIALAGRQLQTPAQPQQGGRGAACVCCRSLSLEEICMKCVVG